MAAARTSPGRSARTSPRRTVIPACRRYGVEGAGALPPSPGRCLRSVDLAQRPGLGREVAGAQRLHPGVVLAVERRDRARAAGAAASFGELNHRPRWYICTGPKAGFWAASGRRPVEDPGSRCHARRHGEGLDAEPPMNVPLGGGPVAFQVALYQEVLNGASGSWMTKSRSRCSRQVVRQHPHHLHGPCDWMVTVADAPLRHPAPARRWNGPCGTGLRHCRVRAGPGDPDGGAAAAAQQRRPRYRGDRLDSLRMCISIR